MKHTRRLRVAGRVLSHFFNEDKVQLYRQDILSEVELLHERGRFSSIDSPPQSSGTSFQEGRMGREDLIEQSGDGAENMACDEELRQEPQDQTLSDTDGRSRHDVQLEREQECVLDCLLRGSFYRSEFDGDKFLALAEFLIGSVFNGVNERTMNKVKADIITAFARKMTTLLSLTKSQSEQLLSFWKTMIVFTHPPSTEIVKRVKASYTS